MLYLKETIETSASINEWLQCLSWFWNSGTCRNVATICSMKILHPQWWCKMKWIFTCVSASFWQCDNNKTHDGFKINDMVAIQQTALKKSNSIFKDDNFFSGFKNIVPQIYNSLIQILCNCKNYLWYDSLKHVLHVNYFIN